MSVKVTITASGELVFGLREAGRCGAESGLRSVSEAAEAIFSSV